MLIYSCFGFVEFANVDHIACDRDVLPEAFYKKCFMVSWGMGRGGLLVGGWG